MIDLHMHSYYSDDGELMPDAVVGLCQKEGVHLMSLSDHNCACGNELARKTAKELGIAYLSGIEISCRFEGTNFHMLGYGIDDKSPDFVRIERNLAEQFVIASKIMLQKTCDLGFELTEQEMEAASKDNYWQGFWTSEEFAEVLLAKPEYLDHPVLKPYRPGGERGDNPLVNFYWDYYSQGKPCYVGLQLPDMKDMIDCVHQNGGIAVLAHPGMNLREKKHLLQPLLELDLDGIETCCSYHTEQVAEFYYDVAKSHGLIATCGSDFHGKVKPTIKMGRFVMPPQIDREQMEKELEQALERKGLLV